MAEELERLTKEEERREREAQGIFDEVTLFLVCL